MRASEGETGLKSPPPYHRGRVQADPVRAISLHTLKGLYDLPPDVLIGHKRVRLSSNFPWITAHPEFV